MGPKNPDVQFILEAPVGSLVASTAEGDFLLEEQTVESPQNGTSADVSPRDSKMSTIYQAEAYMFSDTVPCLRTHFKSKATTTFTSKRRERHPKSVSNTSQGINAKFLVCEFNVNQSFTSAQLLAKIKHHVSSTIGDIDRKCTPKT